MDFYFLAQLAEERRGGKRTAAFLHFCFVLFCLGDARKRTQEINDQDAGPPPCGSVNWRNQRHARDGN
jgi:hypothetical protein